MLQSHTDMFYKRAESSQLLILVVKQTTQIAVKKEIATLAQWESASTQVASATQFTRAKKLNETLYHTIPLRCSTKELNHPT